MKKLLTIILFISVGFSNETKLESDLIEKASTFYFAGKYDSSYVYGSKVLSINPNNPDANLYVGDYYGFQGDFKTALTYYNKAIENRYSFILARYQKASTKMALNSNLEYCSDLEILIELINKDTDYNFLTEKIVFILCGLYYSGESLNDIGISLAQQGSCMYANYFYNQALLSNPQNDKSYYNLSLCAQGTEKEKEFLLKAIEINPKNDGAYRNLGQYYLDKGNEEIAMQYFIKSAQLGNVDVQQWLNSKGQSY